MQSSKYRMISLGIVVETKEDGTDWIRVNPTEILTRQKSGNIREEKEELSSQKPSTNQRNDNTQNESIDYIFAKWRSIGRGNRMSAPDVYQGQQVMIYQFEDTELYYWEEIGREPGLRGKEEVTYAFSNLLGGGQDAEFNAETSYTLKISTKRKYIHLRTVSNDGEKSHYDFKLDTGNGTFRIEDKQGNYIHLDSVAGTLYEFINESITRETKVITDISKEHNIRTDNYTADVSQMHRTNAGTYEDNVDNSSTFNVPQFTVNGSNVHLNAVVTTTNTLTTGATIFSGGGLVTGAGGMGMMARGVAGALAAPKGMSGKSGDFSAYINGPIYSVSTIHCVGALTSDSDITTPATVRGSTVYGSNLKYN